jgi:nitrous oxidase accessory protein
MQKRVVFTDILCFLLISCMFTAVHAATITVHAGENLQAAIDAASPGDLLLVDAGTYTGNFLVPIPLTLQGVGMPVLDGNNALNKDTLTLLADGIQVEGFVITNSARAGINISSGGNLIYGNGIVHNDRYGIAVWGAGNRIEGNNCSDSHGTISRNGIGIYVSNSPSTQIRNNTLLGNRKNGIQASYASFLTMEGNLIASCGGSSGGGHGIRADNSAFIVARDNQIQDCLTDGLYLYNASHSLFQNLTLDNTSTGVLLSGTDNTTFERLTVLHNLVGMDVSSSGTALPDRVFRSCFTDNILQARTSGSVIAWISSTPLPYRFEGRYFENYTGNFWDTYAGADGNGDGIGDLPYPISAGNTDSYPLIANPDLYDWDPDPPDVTPPAAISHLGGDSPDPTTFSWTWQDPPDADLDHLLLYLNGTFLMNLSAGVELLTLENLTPASDYTLSLLTIDAAGNLNTTWVNHTGTTASLPDPTPSPSVTDTPTPSLTTVPTQSSSTTTVPSTGSVRKNTRYFPPPTTIYQDPATPLPTTMETVPSLPETEGVPAAPTMDSESIERAPIWMAEIPDPFLIAPLAGAGLLGYLIFLRRK